MIEKRGIGGIFFGDVDYPSQEFEETLSFVSYLSSSYCYSYVQNMAEKDYSSTELKMHKKKGIL